MPAGLTLSALPRVDWSSTSLGESDTYEVTSKDEDTDMGKQSHGYCTTNIE